jgi:hypothetical protein
MNKNIKRIVFLNKVPNRPSNNKIVLGLRKLNSNKYLSIVSRNDLAMQEKADNKK